MVRKHERIAVRAIHDSACDEEIVRTALAAARASEAFLRSRHKSLPIRRCRSQGPSEEARAHLVGRRQPVEKEAQNLLQISRKSTGNCPNKGSFKGDGQLETEKSLEALFGALDATS